MDQKLAELEQEANAMILEGRPMDAFEKFYADDLVMQENSDAPTVGKDANRQRETEFLGSVEEFHGATLHSWAVGDGVTMSEWTYDLTFKGGHRVQMNEITRRLWRDGKIVHERFYYNAP